MRTAFVCLASVSALLAACSPKGEKAASGGAAATATAPAAAPVPAAPAKPRAGVWRNTMTMANPVPMTIKSDVCLDEAMLKGNDWMTAGKKAGGPDCVSAYKPGPAGYTTHSVCRFSGHTVTSDGVATGDFQSHYRVEMTSNVDPAPRGMPAQTKMSIDAQWIGPCAPGQAGGVVGARGIPGRPK